MLVKNFLVLNIAIAILIWILGLAGLLQLPEGILYDRYVSIAPEVSRATSKILLINCNLSDKYSGDKTWSELIRILKDFEPLRIVFTFLPPSAPEGFYREANLIFGRETIRGRDTTELEPLPNKSIKGLRFGITNMPEAFYGVYRYTYTSFSINGKVYPSIEAAVIKDITPGAELPEAFLINFNGKFHGLPNIDLEEVMAGKLIPELVKDRVVLVGFKPSGSVPSLHTPLSLKGISLSPLEFHGYALDTLLSWSMIKRIHPLMKLLILLGMVILYLTASQLFRIRLSLILPYSILLLIFYLFICYLLFSYLYIWIPIVEILSLHIIVSVTLFTRKAMMEEEGLRKMVLETTVKLEKRLLPESFYRTEDHWSQLITFVSQSLELNRSIFLEKVEGDHRVREVKALNCSLEDIYERRRDYEREPYSTAILENGPVEIEKRSFFKDIKEGEREYIVPLIFVNRVLGFWALSVDRSKVQDIPAFLNMVREYALQISELLYFRQQQQIKLRRKTWWKRFLRIEGTKLFYRELWQNLSVFETRLLLLEKVLERINTATILYDLFGRVIYINKQMIDVLGPMDIRPYEMSALDLGVKLTGIKPERFRGFLQRIILEKDEVSLSVTTPTDINRMYMLYMKPIVYEGGEMPALGVYPFMIMGVIFVLVDVSYLRSLEIFKNDLFTDLDYRLRNHIEAINLAATLLGQESLPEKQKQMALQILTEKINTTNEFIRDMKEHLLKDIFVSDLEHYPVDIKGPLLSAINELKDMALKRGIRINTTVPDLAGFVYASPRLKDVIIEILKVILHDAIDNSEINITLQETEEVFELRISNKGIGLPQEILDRYLLTDTDETKSAELKSLKAAIKQVRQWEGDATVKSDVGKGMTFTVCLKRVK